MWLKYFVSLIYLPTALFSFPAVLEPLHLLAFVSMTWSVFAYFPVWFSLSPWSQSQFHNIVVFIIFNTWLLSFLSYYSYVLNSNSHYQKWICYNQNKFNRIWSFWFTKKNVFQTDSRMCNDLYPFSSSSWSSCALPNGIGAHIYSYSSMLAVLDHFHRWYCSMPLF